MISCNKLFGKNLIACLCLTATTLVAAITSANEYTFTLSPTNGTSPADFASGVLFGTPTGYGDGSVLITSGTMTVTGSSDGNNSVGTYVIYPVNPGAGNAATSPLNNFVATDLVYPGNNAGSGLLGGGIGGNPSYLDNDALLFVPAGSIPSGATEANIWGNGSNGSVSGSQVNPNGDYAFYVANSSNFSSYPVANAGGLTFSLQYVPEPSTMTLACLAAIGTAVGLRVRRRT